MKRQPRDSMLKKNVHNENQSTMKTQTDIGKIGRDARHGIHSGGRLIEMVEQKADKWMIGYLR